MLGCAPRPFDRGAHVFSKAWPRIGKREPRKGGIAIAIQSEMGVPVKYIGVGEKLEDLQKFDSNTFVDALFNN